MLFSINADAWVQTFSVKGKAPVRAGNALNAMLSAYMDLRGGEQKERVIQKIKVLWGDNTGLHDRIEEIEGELTDHIASNRSLQDLVNMTERG